VYFYFTLFSNETRDIDYYTSKPQVHGDNIYVMYPRIECIYSYGKDGPEEYWTWLFSDVKVGIVWNQKLAVHDVDGDGDVDFLVYNTTHLILAINEGSPNVSFVFREVGDIDDYIMIPGYVVYLRGDRLYFLQYDTLDFVGEEALYGSRHLLYVGDTAYSYGSREVRRVLSPLDVEYLNYNFGWDYDQKDTHIVMYNMFRVLDIYPRRVETYDFVDPINRVYATSNGFVVLFHTGGGEVYIYGAKIRFTTDLSEISDMVVFADYDAQNRKLYFALNNSTLIIFNVQSGVIQYRWTPSLTGQIRPVGLYYRDDIYYALANCSGNIVNITIFKGVDSPPWLCDGGYGNNTISSFTGSFVMWDYDGDYEDEIGYSLFFLYSDPDVSRRWYNEYVFAVYDGYTVFRNGDCVREQERSLIRPIHIYSARPFSDAFSFMGFYGEFYIYYSSGFNETVSLDGNVSWACNGILLTDEQIRICSLKGNQVLDFENLIIGVGSEGNYTYSMCLARGFILWNITGSIDLQDPYASIIHPYEGEIINSYTVEVSWDVSDDSGLSSVLLKLDNGSWIDVSGLSSYTFYGVYEGNHTVYLNATDVVGRSTVVSRNFTVVAPFTLSVYCGDNNSLIDRSWVVVEYNTTGSVDRVVIFVNGSERLNTTSLLNGSVNITGFYSGFWLIDVVAYGSGTNVSYTVFVTVDVDSPSISIISPENNSVFVSNTSAIAVHVEFSYSDNFGVDHVEYSLNGSGWVDIGLDTEISILLYTDGLYVLYLRVYDVAGNTNTTRLVFSVDFPASFVVHYAYNNTWINCSEILFSWNSTNIDEVYMYINGEIRGTLGPNGIYTLSLEEGIWNITLVAVGYGDKIVKTLWAKIDLTPPVISVVSPENGSTFETLGDYAEIELVLDVYDNVEVASIYAIYQNKTILISERTTLILGVGEYSIRIVVVDEAGNTNTVILKISVVRKKGGETTTGQEETTATEKTGISGGGKTIGIYYIIVLFLIGAIPLIMIVRHKLRRR